MHSNHCRSTAGAWLQAIGRADARIGRRRRPRAGHAETACPTMMRTGVAHRVAVPCPDTCHLQAVSQRLSPCSSAAGACTQCIGRASTGQTLPRNGQSGQTRLDESVLRCGHTRVAASCCCTAVHSVQRLHHCTAHGSANAQLRWHAPACADMPRQGRACPTMTRSVIMVDHRVVTPTASVHSTSGATQSDSVAVQQLAWAEHRQSRCLQTA